MDTMVEFSQLSQMAQKQVNAIISGKGLGTKEGYADALKFVNERADLRNISVGGKPTGASAPIPFTPVPFTPVNKANMIPQTPLPRTQTPIPKTPTFIPQTPTAPTPYLQAVASSNPPFTPAPQLQSRISKQQIMETIDRTPLKIFAQPNFKIQEISKEITRQLKDAGKDYVKNYDYQKLYNRLSPQEQLKVLGRLYNQQSQNIVNLPSAFEGVGKEIGQELAQGFQDYDYYSLQQNFNPKEQLKSFGKTYNKRAVIIGGVAKVGQGISQDLGGEFKDFFNNVDYNSLAQNLNVRSQMKGVSEMYQKQSQILINVPQVSKDLALDFIDLSERVGIVEAKKPSLKETFTSLAEKSTPKYQLEAIKNQGEDFVNFPITQGALSLSEGLIKSSPPFISDIEEIIPFREDLNLVVTGRRDTFKSYKIDYSDKDISNLNRFIEGGVIGLATSPIALTEFGIGLATEPIGTLKQTGKSFAELPLFFEVDPYFATGYLGGSLLGQEATLGKIGKGIRKGVGRIRTKDTLNIPMESVVAPEYLEGQTFPLIRKGQTAGELLKEFKPYPEDIYGVTSLRGFTASPNPFKPETIAGKGSSELSGVYQAPKLSPVFLRITDAERQLFGLTGASLRPTIIKINPTDFELAPYLRYDSGIAPISKAERFFGRPKKTTKKGVRSEIPKSKSAEEGKSYIPFVKTEKEAIIPEGTKLKRVNRRFHIEFEGIRIPIDEFEALSSKPKTTALSKKEFSISTLDIQEILSSSKLGRKNLVTPINLLEPSIARSSIPKKSSTPSLRNSSLKSPPSTPSSISSIPSSIVSPLSSIGSGASSIASRVSNPSSISSIPSSIVSPLSSIGSGASSIASSSGSPSKSSSIQNRSSQPKTKDEEEIKSYDVYVKAPKRKNFSKITNKPIGLQQARDVRNFFIDQTTSRQGYLKERKVKPSPLMYKVPRGYAKSTDYKFRDFKRKQGKRILLEPERKIEKSPNLLDTISEVKQINIFKKMAELEKKRVKKPNERSLPVGLSLQ